MAVIIGGHESGLLDSSLTLLNRDDRTRTGTTGHGEEALVNVSNGNLLIQQRDTYLPSRGDDFTLVRTYNSRGMHDDSHEHDDGDWQLSTTVRISRRHHGDHAGAGRHDFYEIERGDGSVFVYHYDTARGKYMSTDGAGAYEVLDILNAANETDPAYRLTRADQTQWTFDRGGRLLIAQDTNGVRMTYEYGADRLLRVRDDLGHVITYGYSEGRLAKLTDETGVVLVQYRYDSGRLSEVIDRYGHSTRYYYNAQGLIERIALPYQQRVGTQLETYTQRELKFTYEKVNWYSSDHHGSKGTTWVVSSLTDAEGGVTTFDYQFTFSDNHGLNARGHHTYGAHAHDDDHRQFFNGGTTRVVDALGNKRAYSNDAAYRQWRMDNGYYNYYGDYSPYAQVNAIRNQHALSYRYDEDGYITSVTDQQGLTTTYTYDAKDNLTSITDRIGYGVIRSDAAYYRSLRAELGYVDLAGLGKLAATLTVAEKAALLARFTTTFSYDTRGNLLEKTVNGGFKTTYTYTSFNKLATDTAPEAYALTLSDDPLYQQKRIALGYSALVAGLSAADIQALRDRYTTRYQYDAKQNLIEIQSTNNDLTRFTYDVYGNLTQKTVFLDRADLLDPAKQQVTRYSYDLYGNNTKTIEANAYALTRSDDPYWQAQRALFNITQPSGAGKLVAELNAQDIAVLERRHTSEAQYDHFGNVTRRINPNGGVTSYTYDKDNRLLTVTDPEGHVTYNRYDAVGNRIAIQDANGKTITYLFDRNNMLIATIDPALDGNIARTRRTLYSYDVVGDRTQATDAEGRTTTYTYNGRRELTAVTTATVNNEQGVATRYTSTYSYDGVGRRITATDNRGTTTQFLYTEDGRLRLQTDALGHITQYTYDANRNQVQIIAGLQLAPALRQVMRFGYDQEDQLINQTDAAGNATRHAYDAAGNRVQVINANGHTASFSYDAQNRRIKETRPAVVDPRSGLTTQYSVVHHFDGNGNEVATTDENGHTTRFTFDKDDRTVMITDANGIKTVYTYDSRNNRTSVNVGVQAHLDATSGRVIIDATTDAQVTTYAYDEFNQLTSKTDGMGNALATQDGALYQALRLQMGYSALVAGLTAAHKQSLKNAYTERYTYDRVGNYLSTTDHLGRSTAFAYDALNRRVEQRDALNQMTRWRYDGNGNRVSQTDALGRTQRTSFDVLNRLKSATDALGITSTRSYDAFSNVLTDTQAAGTPEARSTTYVYDLNNRLTTQTDALGHRMAYEYDAVGNRLKVIDAKGQATRYVYDALNRTIKIIDPLNFETKYEYDGAGNRLSLIDAKGGITRFTYDAGNRRIETTDAEGRITQFTYDTRNNRVTQTTAAGTPQAETTTYQYDAENNLAAVIDAAGHTTRNAYDRVYNRTATTDANGHITTYGYDAINRQIQVTDAQGNTTTYGYDAVGNRLRQTDALGRVTTYGYDARDQMVSQVAADGVETRYQYDAVGNRASMTTAANTALAATTQFLYNLDGLLVRQIDPLGHTTDYAYDENHNRVQVTDAGGHVTTYAYDANNRVKRITDALGNAIEYRYDANGNRNQVIDARGYVSTTYYNRNNEVVQTVDNAGYVISFTYDANGNVARQTLHGQAVPVPVDPNLPVVPPIDAADRSVLFAYDKINQLVARTDAEGYVTQYVYDAVGNRTETRVQRDLAGQDSAVTRDYYDNVNRLVASVSAEGYLTEFAYDATGNRVRSTRYNERVSLPTIPGGRPLVQAGDTGRTTAYVYDTNNRLVRETSALGIATLYQYDARGNRISQLDAAATSDQRLTQYRYDAADRLTDTINALGIVTHMQLDADGNVLVRHDAYGTAAQRTTTFAYDGNHRVIQQANAIGVLTHSNYDATGNLIYQAVTNGADNRVETYRYDGNSRLVSGYNAAGEQTTYQYDAAGNRTRLIQALGLAEERTNTFEFDRDNRLVASTDAMGTRTEYRYDGAGNKIETIQAVGLAEQRRSLYTYDLDNRLVRITDPIGAVTRYEYDAIGNQTLIVNANGGVQRNTFDRLGRVVSSLSPGAVLTTNAYDNRGNIVSTQQSWADGSDARITTYAYDLLDHQTRVTDADGFSTSIGYDDFGNQVTIAHGQYLLNPTDAGYDPAKAARAFVVTNGFVYDAANRLRSMTDGVGTLTTYAYDGFGNRLSTTEAANTAAARTTTYVYDRANRVVESRTPEGGMTRYGYDAVGNKTAEDLLQSGDATTGVWIHKTFNYDKNGRVAAEIDAYGVRTEHSYDAMGNMLAHRVAAGTADERTTRMEYDLNNRKTADIDALGNRTAYAYDAMGNRIKATDADQQVARYYYNGASRLTAVLDPEGYVNTFAYDSAGNQTEVRVYMNPYTGLVDDYVAPVAVAAAADRVTVLAYNGVNKEIARVEADGTTTRKAYDGAGNLAKETLFANTASPRIRAYAYDLNNRLTQYTDVDGTLTTFGYDASNNRTRETISSATDPNSNRTTQYLYDLNNRKISDIFDATGINAAGLNIVQTTSYDKLGNVVAKTDGNGARTTFVYDLNNRVLSVTNALGETKSNTYDKVGNFVQQTDARGYSTDYVYDRNNRLVREIYPEVTTYTADSGQQPVRPTVIHVYDAAGNEIQTVDANKNTTTRYYDANNRLAAELSGDQVLRVYAYNAAGDQTSETLYMTRLSAADHNPAARPLPPIGEVRTIEREYDQAGRLTRTLYPQIAVTTLNGTNTNSPVVVTTTMRPIEERNVYDAFGDKIATYNKNNQRTLAYYDVMGRQIALVDAVGHLTEFDYDAQGNVLEQRVYTQPLDTASLALGVRPVPPAGEVYVTSRSYDAANRVVGERAPEISVYDPATGATNAVRPTTVYIYDKNGNPLSKTLAAGTAQAQTEYSYFDAANRRIAVINAGRVLHLYQYDANGNLTRQARHYNTVSSSVVLGTLNGTSNFASLVTADANNDQNSAFVYDAGNHQSSATDLMGPGNTDDLTKNYRYDAAGQGTWVSDEDGYVSQTAYDAAGRVIKTISADGSGTLLEYDAAGNRVYAFTGKIANATLPATQIQTTLGSDLAVSWNVNGPQGTRSWVVYDNVSRADLAGYGSRSAIQTQWGNSASQVHVPTGALGTSLYFRIVTQDAAGNQSWTAEQVVVVPPRFSAVSVAQPSADTLEVSVRFDAGASNPVLYYGVPGTTTTAVPFLLQTDGSYKATLTGITNAQDLAFRFSWADSAGRTYASAEQVFEFRADQVAVSSSVTQGTITNGTTTQYTINVAARLASSVAQRYAVVQAQWLLRGSSSGYAATAVSGTASTAGYTSYDMVLGDGNPLAAGDYDVILSGISADGVATQLDTFSHTIGATAVAANFQGLSWVAPPAGADQLVVIDGRQATSSRDAGRVRVDGNVTATGSVPYTVYYTETLANSHTLGVTSTPVTQTIPHPTDPTAPPQVIVVGYDLGVSVNLSAAEVANKAGDLHLAWRPAGSRVDFGNATPMTSSGVGSFSATLALMNAGEYEIKVYYTDTQGREVIVDWGVAVSTATASTSITSTSRTVVASDIGGFVGRDANGVLTLDPGLYRGALASSSLQTTLTLVPGSTGNPGGSADADGRTTGYYAETQYNALNQQIATNENDGLWRTYGVDANGNIVATRLYGDKGAATYLSSYSAYDARNRKIAEWGVAAQTASGMQHPVTRYTYNVFDKVTQQFDRDTQQGDALILTHRYAYNALGTVIADTDANNNTEKTFIDIFGNTTATVSRLNNYMSRKHYDLLGRMVEERDASGRSTSSSYDAFDRVATMTDGNGNSARLAYDQRDRMTGLTTPLGFNYNYAYDGRNNRTTTTDANRNTTTTQDYDALGRVWRTSSLHNGQPVVDYRGYDAYGNLVSETDGEGRIKAYVYGGFSRLLEEIDEDGNRFIKTYDVYGRVIAETSPQTGKNITRTYDDAGRLLAITDTATSVSTAYTYDLLGRRLTENITTPGNANNRAYTYSYNVLGQLTRWHDAVTGLHLNQHYDTEGNRTHTYTDLGYDPLGTNRDTTGAVINPNYRYVDNVYAYDAARRLTSLVQTQTDATGTPTPTPISAYTYDPAGNRLTWNNKGVAVTYTYDVDRRVTGGTWTEGATNYAQSWNYDANGNVLSFSTNGSGTLKTTTNVFDTQNRATTTDTDGQVTTRTYDRSGRNTQMVMRQGSKTFYYNYSYFGDGREKSIAASGDAHGGATSTYDANNVRILINQGKGDGQTRDQVKKMVVDNDGHVLSLDHDDGAADTHEMREYVYANGNPVGEKGQGVDGTRSVVLDRNSPDGDSDSYHYSLVANFGAQTPTPAVSSYTTRDGDSLQSIAAAVYGNPSLWFVIADANGLRPDEILKPGTRLTIPNNIQQGQSTSASHSLYSESDIIGSTLPNLETPPPPKPKKGCGNIIMIIIVVVIAVVVAFFTAGAGLLLVNAALGTAYTTLAAAAAGSFFATVVATAVAGAVVASIGSIVQQGLFIALGYQEKFSWKQVGSAAVAGAFTGAATAVGAAAKAAEIAAQVGKGAANTASYLKIAAAALRVTGAASKQFIDSGKITSWTSLAGAALGGAKTDVSGATYLGVSSESLQGFVSPDLLKYATPWVQLAETYVRNDGQLTPTDWAGAVGQTLASSVTSDQASPLDNAINRLATNALVAGALSHYDKDAAQGYLENAIGQEVGQYLGDKIGLSLEGKAMEYNGRLIQARQAQTAQVVLPTQADRYLGVAGTGGERRDAYGNPVTPISTLADSGEITTDVTPGLLTGSADQNPNQTPQITTHKLKSGDSYWRIAQDQLGPEASNADVQRQVYALMELNPGLDPRTLQAGQTINLIMPNAGTTLSAGTLAAYGASDAGYQADREARGRVATYSENPGVNIFSDSTNPGGAGESMLSQPDTQFWLERGLDGALELAEQYGLSKQARTLRIQGQSMGYAQAVAESNIFVNAEGVAAKGTRVTATGFSASTLSVTDEGTRLLANPYELIPDSSRLSGSLSTEARMLTAGNAAEAAIVQNLDATLTVTQTTSRALGQVGKVLGGPLGGAALGAGLSYYENVGKVDQTRLEVGLAVDAAFGGANAVVSGGLGIAAAGATSVSGPVAIGIGVGTATLVGGLLDYGFKGAKPFNGMSVRDVVVNNIIDYGIPAYQQAKTYANEYSNRYRLWR